MRWSLPLVALTVALAAGEQVFEDSPALSALWQASSSGSTEAFISQLIQNREYAQHRAADGRGPLFWAYEFKNVDTYALLHHLGVTVEPQEDVDGKAPKEFFTGTPEEMAEFEADGMAKVTEMSALLTEREEEFYAYQQNAMDDISDEDDEDDEAEASEAGKKPSSKVDSIDYADDEDEDYDNAKDEM